MTYSLSATKLVTYKQCPQQYRFRYDHKLKTPAAFGSTELGNALHHALAIAYRDWHYNEHMPGWDWFESCWNQSVQKLSAPQMAEGRDILYRYYCNSVIPAEVMQRPLGVEGRIAAKVQFENIEFALTGRYDRLDNIDGELELIDYKTTKNPTIPDGIDVQLGLYYLALQHVYRRSLKRLTLISLRSGEKHSFEVTQEHEEQVRTLISALALRLRSDQEWEPNIGEHCKRCTYQKYCAGVCEQPEPVPLEVRSLQQVQLVLGV